MGASAATDEALLSHFSSQAISAPTLRVVSGSGAPVPTTPLRIGVVFCGRQCPGGHSVVSGLFDSLPAGSKLLGFIGGEDKDGIFLPAMRARALIEPSPTRPLTPRRYRGPLREEDGRIDGCEHRALP